MPMDNTQKQGENKEEMTFKKSLQTITKIYNSSNGFPTKPKKASFDGKSATFYPFTTSSNQMIAPQIMQSNNSIGQRKLSSSNNQIDFALPIVTEMILVIIIIRPK
jgi:hypothetical protein